MKVRMQRDTAQAIYDLAIAEAKSNRFQGATVGLGLLSLGAIGGLIRHLLVWPSNLLWALGLVALVAATTRCEILNRRTAKDVDELRERLGLSLW